MQNFKCHIKNFLDNNTFSCTLTFPYIILPNIINKLSTSYTNFLLFNSFNSFNTILSEVKENPFIPIAFQREHKEIQDTEYFDNILMREYFSEEAESPWGNILAPQGLKNVWLKARDAAVEQAVKFNKIGVTKLLCRKLLEPFSWINVIVVLDKNNLAKFFEENCPQYIIGDRSKHKLCYKSWKDLCNYHKKFENTDKLENFSTLERLKNNMSNVDVHIQKIAEIMWDNFNELNLKTNV